MMVNSYRTKQIGQTLIETLITILFISVGVIGLIRFQNYLAYDTSLSQQKGDATLLALGEIENLRDYQVLNNTGGYTSYQSIASRTATSTGVNTTYTITSTVTAFVNPTYKKIDVSVTWTDRNNVAQTVRLISNVVGLDPQDSAAVM